MLERTFAAERLYMRERGGAAVDSRSAGRRSRRKGPLLFYRRARTSLTKMGAPSSSTTSLNVLREPTTTARRLT